MALGPTTILLYISRIDGCLNRGTVKVTSSKEIRNIITIVGPNTYKAEPRGCNDGKNGPRRGIHYKKRINFGMLPKYDKHTNSIVNINGNMGQAFAD